MAICIKSKANIKLNQEKYKAITLKSVRRQGCPHSLYLFNMLLEDVARVICNMTTEWFQGHINWKERGQGIIICRGHDVTHT